MPDNLRAAYYAKKRPIRITCADH